MLPMLIIGLSAFAVGFIWYRRASYRVDETDAQYGYDIEIAKEKRIQAECMEIVRYVAAQPWGEDVGINYRQYKLLYVYGYMNVDKYGSMFVAGHKVRRTA